MLHTTVSTRSSADAKGPCDAFLSFVTTKVTFKLTQVIGIRAIWQAIDNFLQVFHCNYVCILHCFRGIITYCSKFQEVTLFQPCPVGVDDHQKTTNLIRITCVRNLTTTASIIPELRLGHPKFKIGHVTTNMPIWGTVCHLEANLHIGNQRIKFEVISFSHSRDI